MSIWWIWLGLFAVGLLLALLRTLLGPRPEDRAVALDVFTVMLSALTVLFGVWTGNSLVLDIALVFSVLSFLGMLLLGRALERGL
ncbi:hypothetical protein KKD52_18050 [Myxococcota bacterium]|jgi:multicomponent Na+:H+ antiporter subunit F|nr:hypothetical protein [Myxococcota bacterium]MBU1242614.1 hypothetical protein [Myxococcota bacterium]MBU1413102.1 hypothetical protein [Myxococcota bacterium]MBU1512257.1 hypothetical protein [Myxococcota bacterium]PKN27068.1 MAG: hypothetical protein CVU65_03635 [Deltaproteobacteria bacterium HGW-Deltaproteobacteria-22]